MKCAQVQTLIGVHDELDPPCRRALQDHIRDCTACAAAWHDESVFRGLVAARPAPPPTPGLESRLLAVPARDWPWRVRHARVARLAAPVAIALVAAGAGLWLASPSPGRPAVDVPPSAPVGLGSAARPVGPTVDDAATAVARASLPPLSDDRPGASAPPGGVADVSSSVRTAGGDDRDARGTRSSAIGGPAAIAAAAYGDGPAPREDRRPGLGISTAPPATADVPTADIPTAATPTFAIPTATAPSVATMTSPPPTAPVSTVRLSLRIEADDPAIDLTGQQAAIQVDADRDGQWIPVYEELLTFAGRLAADQPVLTSPPPYAVALLGSPPGVDLCAGETRRRVLGAGDVGGGQATVVFRVCSTRPSPTPGAAPSPTSEVPPGPTAAAEDVVATTASSASTTAQPSESTPATLSNPR